MCDIRGSVPAAVVFPAANVSQPFLPLELMVRDLQLRMVQRVETVYRAVVWFLGCVLERG